MVDPYDPSTIPGMTGETGYLLPRTGRSLHDAFDMSDPAIVKFGAIYTKGDLSRELIITSRKKSTLGVKTPSGYEAMMLDEQIEVTINSGLPAEIQRIIPSDGGREKMISPLIEYRDFNARLHRSGWEQAVDWIKIEENRLLENGYSLAMQYEDPSPQDTEEAIEAGDVERVSFGTLIYGPGQPSTGVMESYGYWVEGIASGFAAAILPMFVFGVALGACIWCVNWGIQRVGGA